MLVCRLTLAVTVVTSCFSQAIHVEWLPITPAERELKTPVIEKSAGVEALFWRVHVTDTVWGGDLVRDLYHYVRLKVFTEAGKAMVAAVELPYDDDRTSILEIAGRTIRADGTELKLTSQSIFDKEILRAGRARYKVKSLAMPGIEPGAIIEYRWKERRLKGAAFHLRLQLQREYPVHRVTYFVKPLSGDYTAYRMYRMPFNCQPSDWKDENNGFQSSYLENVPAFKEEPLMPGEPNVRPWMLIFYKDKIEKDHNKYWESTGRELYRNILKSATRQTDEIRRAAMEATAGAATEQDKVTRLLRFLRTNTRNVFDRSVSDGERTRILKSLPAEGVRTADAVLASKIGTADELNLLFAAMAAASGLDARPALVGDSQDVFFDPKLADRYFLPHVDMAVKYAEGWQIHDVTAKRLPAGMVSWREENMQALVSDPKKPFWVSVPPSAPEQSSKTRVGRFRLTEEGTLTGDVTETLYGHQAAEERLTYEQETPERQSEKLKEHVLAVFPGAEVTAASVEGVSDPELPVRLKYTVTIPGYAARTGRRILFRPLYFQSGEGALFTASDRVYPIQFRHAWRELDTVSIEWPEGFELDNAESPGRLEFGAPGGYKVQITRRGRTLTSTRELVFGRQGALYFGKESYKQIKGIFDDIQGRDQSTMSLKLVTASGAQ
jgi:hypothetical protein